MDKEQIYRLLCTEIDPVNIKVDEPMKAHTSFKIGGPADIFVTPDKLNEIYGVLRICGEHGVPLLVMGNGTDLLVLDGGIRGVVMQIAHKWAKVDIENTLVTVQSGILLSRLCRVLAKRGLGGMEFAAGIPGTLGGALVMNAGAYGGEMKDVVQSVHAIDANGNDRWFRSEELKYGYRSSIFRNGRYTLLEAKLCLEPREPQVCMDNINDLNLRRRAKQPLEYPSAGSVFKRPCGCYVGPMIEQAGLKGMCVGDAQVSEKHAGFIINRGNATAKDVLELINIVKQRIKELFAVELELEIQVVGEEN
ncbi:UDP-N-acetylmuramate dehydrogenase [Mahella australiensis]|uniref:UDP-N-acetylenolpyruvoylglucosamine reductase n=1 Tax=Mahella australiensis (strain DSM 15567 / CIP 107919 / 50-1 BON) TaxID=697281 RepID=F4A191_MAHA5|nr:UDP-N-acetylmuramate dehydrogenase [Mahella australiensis]AEE97010.1 UDP-N-acetylmuramate dehydrogenase [Mahella australiensis 50-1 BON]